MERLVIQGSTISVVSADSDKNLLCSENLDDLNTVNGSKTPSDNECMLDSEDSYSPSDTSSDTESSWSVEDPPPRRSKGNPRRKRQRKMTKLTSASVRDAGHQSPAQQKGQKSTENSGQSVTLTQEAEKQTIKAKRSKRGMSEREQWDKNTNKELRRKGKAYRSKYKNKNGETITKHRESRQQGPPCSSAFCRKSAYRSCATISAEDRKQLFTSFWDYMTWEGRKTYIASLVFERPQKQKRRKESRRSCTLLYHLRIKDEMKQVCKEMFLSTFGLKEWTVRSWAKMATNGVHPPSYTSLPSATNQAKMELARAFVEALPKLPSHYCRQGTDKTYLEGIESKSQLYRLFQSYCDSQNTKRVCRQVLVQTLRMLNVGIQKPRKDQCNTYLSYKYGYCSQEDYDKHIKRKNEAREEKTKDKRLAKDDDHVLVLTMDLQHVLLAPRLFANANYFKTKLCCDNFTVYDLATKRVVCYFWHEGQGGVTSNNFASCIVDYIKEQTSSRDIHTIIIFSDGCGYQNRNLTLANSLLLTAMETNTTIIQKILEKGHTWMEADSVHSAIERRLQNRQIYWPAEYIEVFSSARTQPEPYHVKNLTFQSFSDFSQVSFYKTIRPGSRPGDPHVTDIRALKYGTDGVIHYKLHHSDEWSHLPSRPNRSAPVAISPLYCQPPVITKTKFEHLQQLKHVIPREYHSFYDQLPHE